MSTLTEEEAVLTEARVALERYALRLPDESKWQAYLERLAANVGDSAILVWMRELHSRGIQRQGQEAEVLAEMPQTLKELAVRLPESSPWRETLEEVAGSIERKQQGA